MPKILLAQSGSGLQFIELTCLLKVLRWPVMVSYGMVFNCSQEEFSLLLACGEGKSWITTERNLLKDPKTTSILALVKTIYYIDKTVLVENRPLVKFIRNYIRDLTSVFSISSQWGYRRRYFPLKLSYAHSLPKAKRTRRCGSEYLGFDVLGVCDLFYVY